VEAPEVNDAPATTPATTDLPTTTLWEEFGPDDATREANLRQAVRRLYVEIAARPHLRAYFKDKHGNPMPPSAVEGSMMAHLATAAQAPKHLFPHPPMDIRFAHIGEDKSGQQTGRDLGITKEHAVETVGLVETILTDMRLAASTVQKVVGYLVSRAGDVISPKADTAGAAA
jgi:hypothetical protein